MSDFDTLHEQGLADRGDLLGEAWEEPAFVPAAPVIPPRLPDAPEFPEPGIYFGMPEGEYHAIHACSTSGLKWLSVSSMDYWARSPLNPDREDQERKDYFDFGNAIHTLVLEGEETYAERYVIGLDKDSIEGLIEGNDAIKARIVELGSKPCTFGYDDNTRKAKKEDWIAQLRDLDPNAKVWETIKAEFDALHADAEIITHKIDKRVRIAARMILAQPDIAENFRDGYAEVSVFWYCPVTGCPMKARFDYLKLKRIVDLKSMSGKSSEPVDRQVIKAIASYRYIIQQVVYEEAAAAAKRMIREGRDGVIPVFGPVGLAYEAVLDWCIEWAEQPEPDFLFVFFKTGIAPVVRGKIMPRELTYSVAERRVEDLKRAFVANCEVYGSEMWVDARPIEHLSEEDFPLWTTDF